MSIEKKNGILCFLILLLSVSFCLAQDADKKWPYHIIDDSSEGPDGVRLLDVNGDNLMDLVTGWEEGNVTRAYLHPGYDKVYSPWPAVSVGRSRNAEDAVFVDLDGDGAYDVVSSTEGGSKRVIFHWAPANKKDYMDEKKWKTEDLPASVNLSPWMYCVPMQIDGQNGIDLVVGGKNRTGSGQDAKPAQARLGWFRSPQNPRDVNGWTYHPLTDSISWIMSLMAADIDGDGNVDVVATDRQECFWLKNPGKNNVNALLTPWKRITLHGNDGTEFPLETQLMFGCIADLDKDGLEDVIITVKPQTILWLRRVDASGLKWEKYPITFAAETGTIKGVAVGDINADGKNEIVFSCSEADIANGTMWLSYNKSPKEPVWQAHTLSGIHGKKFDQVYLYDFNGDGKLDVISTEEQGGERLRGLGVVWYENPL